MLEELTNDVLIHGSARRLLLCPSCAFLRILTDPLWRDQTRLKTFAQFGEFLVQAQEQLELGRFFNRWDQRQFLQILVEVARALFGLSRGRCKMLVKLFRGVFSGAATHSSCLVEHPLIELE